MKKIFIYFGLGGIFVFAILAIMLGIYTMTQLSEISDSSREIREASEIALSALDFNVENFHTQLEVWEYAYDPSEKRLNAFEIHDNELTVLLDDLLNQVELETKAHKEDPTEINALARRGDVRIRRTVGDLEKVRADWENLFESVNEQRRLSDLGYNDVNSANYLEYLDALEKSMIRMEINEALFDTLEFNKEVDKFVEDQKDLVWKLQLEQKSIIQRFSILFFILIIVLILFNVAVVMGTMKIFNKGGRRK